MPERQVDDVDLQLVAVLDGELESAQHGARISRAVAIEHLEADDARFRRDAAIERDFRPVYVCRLGSRRRRRSESLPLPAISVATCVPWP